MFQKRYEKLNQKINPSDQLIADTMQKMSRGRTKATLRPIWQIGAAAACAVCIAAAAIAIPQLGDGPSAPLPNGSNLTADASVEGKPAEESKAPASSQAPAEDDRLVWSADKKLCRLNKVKQTITVANLPFHGPDTHDYFIWGEKELFDYLGREVSLTVPEGLEQVTDNPQWQIIRRKNGEMFYDACTISYADKLDAEGYPTADARTMSVMTSKRGYYYGILYADEEPLTTNVCGTEVTFGMVTYGEEANHQVYSAFFEKDGITYSLMSRHNKLVDFYRAVEALIKA